MWLDNVSSSKAGDVVHPVHGLCRLYCDRADNRQVMSRAFGSVRGCVTSTSIQLGVMPRWHKVYSKQTQKKSTDCVKRHKLDNYKTTEVTPTIPISIHIIQAHGAPSAPSASFEPRSLVPKLSVRKNQLHTGMHPYLARHHQQARQCPLYRTCASHIGSYQGASPAT